MKEAKKDLFDCLAEPGVDAICITTNANYTEDGIACMGGGCAGACAKRFPETAKNLGYLLKYTRLNVPFIIGMVDNDGKSVPVTVDTLKNKEYKCLIYSFPTIHDIWDGSDLDLIVQSAQLLVERATKHGLKNIILPRPGVGIGGLNWTEVKPAIENILDDRFTIVSFEHEA